MLQAQSVFILGIYEGEYSPPKKYQVFLVFWPRILHCYKKPVAHPGGCIPTGTHSAPKLAILRSEIGEKNFTHPHTARLRPHPPPPLQKATNCYNE